MGLIACLRWALQAAPAHSAALWLPISVRFTAGMGMAEFGTSSPAWGKQSSKEEEAVTKKTKQEKPSPKAQGLSG